MRVESCSIRSILRSISSSEVGSSEEVVSSRIKILAGGEALWQSRPVAVPRLKDLTRRFYVLFQ